MRVIVPTGLAAGILAVVAGPAYAIPSPDLIAGSLSSLSQIAMLLSATIGGLAFTGTRLLPRARLGLSVWAPRSLWIILGGASVVLAISLAANLYQYLSRDDARLARIQATLIRPSHNPGEPILDPTLKELSYQEQLGHPAGITTQQVEDLLHAADEGKAEDVNFLDIRETGETELGKLPHFTAIRWPDLFASGIDLMHKRNVLICHNGNRSSETCEALRAQGIPCEFMVGGLEKWIAEGREIGDSGLRSPAQLRGVPPYPNDRVFLDTPDVHRLVDEEKAIILDTRYPGEFAHSHIPGAINIAIRREPTAALRQRISELPRRPVVLACYDRRSCFMSTVLGLELSRAGFDVRGRYTLPWEYYLAAEEPPYIKAWRKRVGAGFWTKTSRALGVGVSWFADRGLGLPATILLLALVSRLLVFPVSLKAERDQAKLKALAGETAALKQRLRGDGKQYVREIKSLHRRHGITPGRNLLALLFLPVLALCVAAVDAAAAHDPQSLWWLKDLADRDHAFILPSVFSALVTLYLALSLAQSTRQRIITVVLGFPSFAALVVYLSAGADLYMVASACLMLAQRAIVAVDPARLRRVLVSLRARRNGVIALAEAHLLPGCGNKAAHLGMLLAHGMPVPPGLVLTPHFLEKLRHASETRRRRHFDRLWRKLGANSLAVRSSALAEDGAARSFAGVFQTVLNVDRSTLGAAIAKVAASVTAGSESYGAAAGVGGIILQPMIAARYAGVLFTQDPSSGGLAMVEMVEGTADAFVSGAAAPATYRLGRYTGQPASGTPAPLDLAPLFALGRRVEAVFGAPQDIEWAYEEGRFFLLQSRDITCVRFDDAVERERARLLDIAARGATPEVSFVQNELSELVPRPTPLSLDLMEQLWRAGGAVHLACRALGLTYDVDGASPPNLVTVFGRLYIDRSEERRRAVRLGPLDVRRLQRAAGAIEAEYRTSFLPGLAERMCLLEAADFSRLSMPDLQKQLERTREDYVFETGARVEIINIAAQYYLEKAQAALKSRGLDPGLYLGARGETPLAAALAAAGRCENDEARIDAFLARFGHRAPLDYELAQPRYSEDRGMASALAASVDAMPRGEKQVAARDWQDPDLAALIDRARRFQSLKEDAKHESLREIAVMRAIVLALDRLLSLEGKIFFLTFAEILEIGDVADITHARAVIARRTAVATAFAALPPLPTALTMGFLETVGFGPDAALREGDGDLTGMLVSGGAPVTGRACVVAPADAERGTPLPDFATGDILVSRMMHPAWLPYFRRAGGLVCEIGGWLSHVAILARECGVPMMVGVHGIAEIRPGEPLRLHADGRVERLDPMADLAEVSAAQ